MITELLMSQKNWLNLFLQHFRKNLLILPISSHWRKLKTNEIICEKLPSKLASSHRKCLNDFHSMKQVLNTKWFLK